VPDDRVQVRDVVAISKQRVAVSLQAFERSGDPLVSLMDALAHLDRHELVAVLVVVPSRTYSPLDLQPSLRVLFELGFSERSDELLDGPSVEEHEVAVGGSCCSTPCRNSVHTSLVGAALARPDTHPFDAVLFDNSHVVRRDARIHVNSLLEQFCQVVLTSIRSTTAGERYGSPASRIVSTTPAVAPSAVVCSKITLLHVTLLQHQSTTGTDRMSIVITHRSVGTRRAITLAYRM